MLATLAQAASERWSPQDELLAAVVELIDQGNRNFEQAHSRKGAPRRQPIRVPRPKRKSAHQMSSPDEVRAFMARR